MRDLPPAPNLDDDDPQQRLAEERQRLLADLYDLEQAFHAGRLSRRDHDRLRAEVGGDLALVLDQLERLGAAGTDTPAAGVTA